MKSIFTKARLAAAAITLATSSLTISSASAYTVYHLEPGLYAIICQDGQIFSYAGGPEGIGIVGPALCEGHGGIVGGGGGGIDVLEADRQLARSVQQCQRGRGEQVRSNVMRCADKASPQLLRQARGGGSGKVSVQDMERSRD